MTAPQPPSVGVTTVARLDTSSAWRRYRSDESGAGWVRLDQRLADPEAMDAWYQAELEGTAAGHGDLAGSLIVYRFAGALAELVVGPLIDQRRVVRVTPGNLSLRLVDRTTVEGLSVAAPLVAVLPGDPDAGRPGATTVADGAALRSAAVDGLMAVFDPLATAVRARASFGLRGMWGTLADHLAEVALWRARHRGRDAEAAWSLADALIRELADRQPLLVARPRPQLVDAPAGSGVFSVKGTCCLLYKTAPAGRDREPAAVRRQVEAAGCASCPLRSEEDRRHRFVAYLGRQVGR